MSLAAIAASCSGAGDGAATDGMASGTTTASGADDPGAVEATDASIDVAQGESGAFPVTIGHAFGETTIPAEPQRIVAYGFEDHSFALALGVVPVGLRKAFDDQSFTVWPWAQAALGGAEPLLLGALEPSLEEVAALEPDLILASTTLLDEPIYGLLSSIAPTLARPAEYNLQATPWRELTEIIGRALGRNDEAAAVIADLDQRFTDATAAHPDFVGATASVAFFTSATGRLGSYEAANQRYQFLAEIGFAPPAALIAETVGADISIELGLERIELIDADVVIWNPGDEDGAATIREIPTREVALSAATERREIIADLFLSQALTEASPLSWHYALDRLVPELAAAIDGDPSNPAPSALGLYELAGTAATPEEQAAMDAWAIALSSDSSLEQRRPHIEDFDMLSEVIAEAFAAGEELGGVVVTPKRATVTGDAAAVLFDAALGDAMSTDLTANLDLVDGVWVARRTEVCIYIGFLGIECPA